MSTMPADVRIDAMRIRDIAQVAAIDQESFPTPWPPHSFYYELRQNEHSHFFVARLQTPPPPWYMWWRTARREIVGYAGYWLVVDEAHISTIAVRPDRRGQGIGEGLLRTLLRDAFRRGAVEATLEVRESNTHALALYQKYGFETVGRRKGYYRDSGEDALLMTARPVALPLPPSPSPLAARSGGGVTDAKRSQNRKARF